VSSSVRDTSVSREELRRRTSELVPILKERAARTEQLRQIPPETVQDLVASGLIRLGNPPRYGGLDVEYDAAFDLGFYQFTQPLVPLSRLYGEPWDFFGSFSARSL